MSDDLVGMDVGRYRLERVLGEGGMGRVYLGVDAHQARVAIKVLSKQTPELVKRFFAEARAVSLISHANIVNLVDLAELPDGRPYMVMELVEGESLRDVAPRLALAELARLLGEVLAAIAAAHTIGIVHRDLKPDNIMVTRSGHAKVLDFGVAKLAAGIGNGMTPRTKEGVTMGTPAYMAPEQVTGGAVDARTDVYAMGVVMFEALTGQRPFVGATDFDVMRAHRDRPPPRLRSLVPTLPAAVEDVVLRALHKSPARRYASAGALATAFADAVAGKSDAETVVGRPLRAATVTPPSRWPMIIALVCIAIAAGVVFAIARARRDAARGSEPPLDAAVVLVAPAIDAAPIDAAPVDAAVPPIDAAPADASVSRSLPAPPRAATEATHAVDYEPTAFDPIVAVTRATQIARELAADAELVSVYVRPVGESNKLDLRSATATAELMYISPAAARAGSGARPCLVRVQFTQHRVLARVLTDARCLVAPVRAPRCSLAQVRAAAGTTIVSLRDVPLTMTYRGTWTVKGRVSVYEPSGVNMELPDDC